MTDETDKIAVALESSRTPGVVVRSPGSPWDDIAEITMSGTVIPWAMPGQSALNATVERMAKRLGVEPYAPSGASGAITYVINGEDGRSYGVFDLAHAVLDRLDAAASK